MRKFSMVPVCEKCGRGCDVNFQYCVGVVFTKEIGVPAESISEAAMLLTRDIRSIHACVDHREGEHLHVRCGSCGFEFVMGCKGG